MADRPRHFGPKTGKTTMVVLTAVFCSAICRGEEDTQTSLTLIPPSPVTDKICMDIRAAVWNHSNSAKHYQVRFYLDEESDACLLHQQDIAIAPRACKGVKFTWPAAGRAGKHEVLFTAMSDSQTLRTRRPLEILASQTRSTKRIEGAWFEFYHWSEAEGRLWNEEIKTLTDDDWKELITGMHAIGMNIVVIQDTYYNPDRYVGKHTMEKDGFVGRSFYPSALYPRYQGVSAADPLEAVLSQADEHGMHVMVGVGGYAWFDFTPGSLQWHKAVADELWKKYGRHPSFFGWYVSEEIAGNLGADDMRRQQIVDFFREFTRHVRSLAPDKPVMLASNCHHVEQVGDYYPKLLEHLDILCPFGFHRMPPNDYTGEEVAAILQRYCDTAGAHLWMDMEVFLFGPQNELFPRPIDGVIDDLMRFPNFEKICCYSYTGLMNSPRQSRTPGGPATVALYNAYRKFLVDGPPDYTIGHAAVGCGVKLLSKCSTRYSKGDLVDGRIAQPDFRSDGWLGFENQDLHAVVDLGEPLWIETLQARFFRNDTAAIALPSRVEFSLSMDGGNYASAAVIEHAAPGSQMGPSTHVYAEDGINKTARYVRICAESAAQWLFVDEIIVNPVQKPLKER
ncbi:MAG: DUF4434 domain-containing protein [Phycisphaerae bacterium]|nr:DUF4434 domain-containing protein [Phycisphaerae bacterium]